MVKCGDFSVIRTAIDACFGNFYVVSHVAENRILVTEGTHVATLYDLSTRSALKSWCFPESSPLSAPVVFDSTLEKFVAIQQSSVIVCFEMNDDIIEGSRIKLSSGAYCVFGHPKFGTFVLFKNGCLKYLRQVQQNNSIEEIEGILKSYERIVWAQIDSSNGDELTVFVVTENENENCVYNLVFDTINGKVIKTTSNVLSQKYKFFTLDEENKSVLGLNCETTVSNLQNEEFVFKFPEHYENNISSIAWMSDNKLIVTVRTKSELDVFKLEIWDLSFKLNISEITLDLVPLTNAIGVHGSNIFVSCSKGITTIPFDVKNVTLASVLGKAMVIDEINTEADADLKEISEKITSCGPQERERLQVAALDVALKKNVSDEEVLLYTLRHPFSEQFAIQSLKNCKYSVEEVIKLLDMLNSLVVDGKNLFVINWMCVLIDAYFKQLILQLRQDTKVVLNNILATVDSLAEYCDKVQELRHLVDSLGILYMAKGDNAEELPMYSNDFLYRVEWIQL